MRRIRLTFVTFIVLLSTLILSGCSDKNTDFDYMKEAVKSIVIKNNRDIGLQFTISDSREIQKIYGILSSGMPSNNKSSLSPDYKIEIIKNDGKSVSFDYVMDSSGSGNLFNEANVYDIPKRLDEEIFSYLDKLKRPKDFTTIYYTTIEKVVEKYRNDTGDNTMLTLLINQDKEVQRFIYSKDLENFKNKMSSELNIISGTENQESSVIFTLNTKGYNTTTDITANKVQGAFKAKVEIHNEASRIDKTYYIYNEYLDNKWNYNIYDNATDYNNHASIRD